VCIPIDDQFFQWRVTAAVYFLLEGRLWGILTGMRLRYRYLLTVLLGLAILAYLFMRSNFPLNFPEIWSSVHQAKHTQSDVGKTPDVTAFPNDELEKLRRKHHLRPLTELEDGTKIQDLPNGIYGFSMCRVVSLSAKRGTTHSLEIHKHHDGIVYYVGYASDEHIRKYLAREMNFHILTFPHSWERTSTLFEIPVAFISKCESRPSRDGYLFDFFISEIPVLND
jgi:hypothetical protein